MTTIFKANKAFVLLKDLLSILESQHEKNWSRGLKSAIAELLDSKGNVIASGFDNERSIYNTMTAGGGGLSEYFVGMDDEDKRLQLNEKLDMLRRQIWAVFND